MIGLTTIARASVMTVAATAMAACAVTTQIDSLRPVAGDKITGLNIAATDVLVSQGVEILVAPVCEYANESYDCAGTTLSGKKIAVTAAGAEPESMTVTVGSKTIYDGSIDEVLQQAARG